MNLVHLKGSRVESSTTIQVIQFGTKPESTSCCFHPWKVSTHENQYFPRPRKSYLREGMAAGGDGCGCGAVGVKGLYLPPPLPGPDTGKRNPRRRIPTNIRTRFANRAKISGSRVSAFNHSPVRLSARGVIDTRSTCILCIPVDQSAARNYSAA